MQMVTLQVPTELARKILDLPESDLKPMGETEYHIRAILELFQLLDAYFRDDENVYVGADMLYYYDADSPTEYIVPDVFVVKGVKKTLRPPHFIRPIDPKTGEPLPTYAELEDLAEEQAQRAQAEAERALRAERENEQLRAELERLRRQSKD